MCAPLPTGGCPGGQTLDSCHCCKLCARVEGETCHTGGYGEDERRCDDGLICKIDPPPGALIGQHHIGICHAVGKSVINVEIFLSFFYNQESNCFIGKTKSLLITSNVTFDFLRSAIN